jgi:hypothetical protein
MISRAMTTEGFVVFTCGSCGTKLKVRPSAEGRTAKCPKCGARLRIEIPTAAAPQQSTPVPVAAATDAPQPPPPPQLNADVAFELPVAPAPVAVPAPPPAPVPENKPELTPQTAVAPSVATIPAASPVEAAAGAATIAEAPVSSRPASESRVIAPEGSPGPVAGAARPTPLIAIKSFILLAAVAVIGAFGWFAVVHYGGAKSWIVKQSVVAGVIGFLAASVVLAAGGRGVMAKLASVVAALIAIVLGKAMVVALIDADPGAVPAHDVRAWVSFFAGHAFNVIDVLFAAIAVTGAAIRFILARP